MKSLLLSGLLSLFAVSAFAAAPVAKPKCCKDGTCSSCCEDCKACCKDDCKSCCGGGCCK